MHDEMMCYYFQPALCSCYRRRRVLTCCSLATVPNKSPAVAVVTADAEKTVSEDEEKLVPSAADSES